MDVQIINPFIRSTEKVFSVMVGCSIAPQAMRAYAAFPPGEKLVHASVTLCGGASGIMILRFPTDAVLRIGMAFAGEAVTFDDAYDAVGELANMVAGGAKRELGNRLVEIGVPKIAIGQHELGDVTELSPWLVVPLTASASNFELCVSISGTHRESGPATALSDIAAAPA